MCCVTDLSQLISNLSGLQYIYVCKYETVDV